MLVHLFSTSNRSGVKIQHAHDYLTESKNWRNPAIVYIDGPIPEHAKTYLTQVCDLRLFNDQVRGLYKVDGDIDSFTALQLQNIVYKLDQKWADAIDAEDYAAQPNWY